MGSFTPDFDSSLKWEVEKQRKVFFNNPVSNEAQCKHFRAKLTNEIITSKYTLVTFLPQNLLEQFNRIANFYFLIILILKLIPQISSLVWYTTAVPLVFVLAITAVKDGADDLRRHKSDKIVNNRTTIALRNGKWEQILWRDVRVGDIIHARAEEYIPADLVVLSTSEDDGTCYVDSAELDGETALKLVRALPHTHLIRSEQSLASLSGTVEAEPPNNRLYKFTGTYTDETLGQHSVDAQSILLRGCVIRNTKDVYGLVFYSGSDTKLMQNAGKVRFKRTSVDKRLNALVIWAIVIVLFCCFICAVLSAHWERTTGDAFEIYLARVDASNADMIGFLQFWSYLILLNTMVPISLYACVELIRLAQSWLINWDLSMYDEATDTPAAARSTCLTEELGQIDYIFSDKTGTLTRNIMKFSKCLILGHTYEGTYAGEEQDGAYSCLPLSEAINKRDAGVVDFFLALALCHSVQHEVVDGVSFYQAQSPDEKALVQAACDLGVVYDGRIGSTLSVKMGTEVLSFELLHTIEFDSTRKRMTVVLRMPDGRIRAYSKGADVAMFPLCTPNSRSLYQHDMEEQLTRFSSFGLRTLVVGAKDVDESWYASWTPRLHAASVSLVNREELLERVAAELEIGFDILGASAVEDKLQTGVPQTIHNLKLAGIKIWMLTGDKQETAINIGYSCSLLTRSLTEVFVVNGSSPEDVRKQLESIHNKLEQKDDTSSFGFVIDGASLLHCLMPGDKEMDKMAAAEIGVESHSEHVWTAEKIAERHAIEDLFVSVTLQCEGVVCCRMSPLQKAQIVATVIAHRKAVTLAIGDGANDVSMIKLANVGVGISGLEGRQAVLASDYAIAQFSYLERLLLVHGRWSYLRMCVFLRYFFYKNFAYTMGHFWFSFFCGYSAQTVYDSMLISLFNVTFSMFPILVVGVAEQDVGPHVSGRYPHLYQAGQRNLYFSNRLFLGSLGLGMYHSIVIYFVAHLALFNGAQFGADGVEQGDLYSLSNLSCFVLVMVVNIELALQTTFWTSWNLYTWLVGPVTWFLVYGLLSITYAIESFGTFQRDLATASFWFAAILGVGLACLPTLFIYFWVTFFRPTPVDIVRERHKYGLDPKSKMAPEEIALDLLSSGEDYYKKA